MIYDIQKFAEVEMANLDRYLEDPTWVMEQKMDGTRGIVSITTKKVWWPGRGGGGVLSHTAATQWLPRINPLLQRLVSDDDDAEFVLDGEIMIHTGEFIVFDVLYVRLNGVEVVTQASPFELRRAILDSPTFVALLGDTGGRVKVIRQARTRQEKRVLLTAVEESGGEGVMVKNRYAKYQPGGRSKDGLKIKFVKTADVVVTGSTRGRNEAGRETGSFTLAVVDDDGRLVEVGACSAIGKPAVEVGDVIEVAYLYFTGKVGTGSLYQPRMVRLRRDKEPIDCGPDQFPLYSRAVV